MSPAKKKILILTLGTRGDVQPFAAVAQRLAASGHDVVLSSGQGFEEMIAAAGATSRPVSLNYEDLVTQPNVKEALHSVVGMVKIARWGLQVQRRIAEELWQIGLDTRPDLILFNPKGVVGTLLGRALKVPAIPVMMQPLFSVTGAFPPQMFNLPNLDPALNRLLHRAFIALLDKGMRPSLKSVLGRLSPDFPADRLLSGHLPSGAPAPRLQAYSATLTGISDDWPSTDPVTGYWFKDPDPDYVPPKDLATFLDAGPAPVYVGFGSMPSRKPAELTRTILDAIEATDIRAIVALGWGGLEAGALQPRLRERVHVLKSVPHSWLFPHCAAVVHHGGAGTTHEGLRWGRPSLVCPVFGDQPYWGRQVARLGAGPPPLRAKKLTADKLAGALRDLETPDYAKAAARIAEKMAAEGGVDEAATRLEAVLAGDVR
ncbi:glycosyltransferase [uncultured Roseibium sp.]|uniref:glycosyltransferase n=1 Tax=uncultured Roseibium sp. TaxID=1936171 RepID=UPI003216CFD7